MRAAGDRDARARHSRRRIRAGAVGRGWRVGDEPRDIVFAGPAFDRAFVTTAQRDR
jgi:hypothetical protein